MTLTAKETAEIALIIDTLTDYRANPLNYMDTSETISFGSGYNGGGRIYLKPFSRVLQEKGSDVSFLGAGCFGSVFELSDDKVIKLLHREDEAYLTYAQHCMTNSSPILPKIYEMGQIGETNLYYFVLEALKAFDEYMSDMEIQYKVIRQYFSNRGEFGLNLLMNEETKSAIDAIKALRNNSYRHLHNDLHSGNVMFRKIVTDDQSDWYYQAVITDPYS